MSNMIKKYNCYKNIKFFKIKSLILTPIIQYKQEKF